MSYPKWKVVLIVAGGVMAIAVGQQNSPYRGSGRVYNDGVSTVVAQAASPSPPEARASVPGNDPQMDNMRRIAAGLRVYEDACSAALSQKTHDMITSLMRTDPQSSAKWLVIANAIYANSPGTFCSAELENVDKLGWQ